jgi:SWIM zinc finger
MNAVATNVEHHYRYFAPSELSASGELLLATSIVDNASPWLAAGFANAPQHAARSLLLVANVARTRFFTPPNMVAAAIAAADPVVTTSAEAIRFEAFSPCGGVYVRFDLDTSSYDGVIRQHGTTNVDVNPPLRAALSRVGARDPLHISVGTDSLAVATLDGQTIERNVPLPRRWIRGFAEVAVAMAPLEPRFALRGAGLRSFLEGLPTTASGKATSWIVPSGSSARLSSRAGQDAVPAGGLPRLRILRELAPFVDDITFYGEPNQSATEGTLVCVLTIQGGHVTFAISPTSSRGFSGEGGLLSTLLQNDSEDGAVSEDSDVGETLDRYRFAAAGLLGYDVARANWFDRALPFDRSTFASNNTRDANARNLFDNGAVTLTSDRLGSTVTTSGGQYRVRNADGAWRCTCPWWGQHRGERGPCKHVLATMLAL